MLKEEKPLNDLRKRKELKRKEKKERKKEREKERKKERKKALRQRACVRLKHCRRACKRQCGAQKCFLKKSFERKKNNSLQFVFYCGFTVFWSNLFSQCMLRLPVVDIALKIILSGFEKVSFYRLSFNQSLCEYKNLSMIDVANFTHHLT